VPESTPPARSGRSEKISVSVAASGKSLCDSFHSRRLVASRDGLRLQPGQLPQKSHQLTRQPAT
jgi:hypothetical protein